MNSPPSEWTRVLSSLDKISGSTLCGVAIASAFVLFSTYTFGIDLGPIRQSWGGWLLVALAFCFSLLGAKIMRYLSGPKSKQRRNFILTPHPQQCWWHVAQQKDGSYVTQLVADCDVLNLAPCAIRFHALRLISPKCKGEVVHADVGLFNKLNLGRDFIVPAHTDWVRTSIMIRQKLGSGSKPLKITIGITDSLGIEQKIKLTLRAT